jgi:isopentenyl diphosphate isomerase/L-lactate dehydrogenase-like FMN-dependent dehydrogenase
MSLDCSSFQFFIVLWFISKFILPPSPGEISGNTILILSPNSERGLGIDVTGITTSNAMIWDFFKRLRDTTKMKIVIKGILAHEDSGRSTIDALPEIIEAVGGRMPILVDSGFRRGSDIVNRVRAGYP